MAKQTINLGTAPTGVGGDTPRSAFTKAQSNIDELYAALGAGGNPVALPASLPIAQGGTGGTTAASARSSLGLKSAAIYDAVGTVSTGAIMETAANANGTYTKYADGTLICRGMSAGSYTTANGWTTGLYITASGPNLVFPSAFVVAPTVVPTSIDSAGSYLLPVVQAVSGTSVIILGVSASPTGNSKLGYIAIGRWF